MPKTGNTAYPHPDHFDGAFRFARAGSLRTWRGLSLIGAAVLVLGVTLSGCAGPGIDPRFNAQTARTDSAATAPAQGAETASPVDAAGAADPADALGAGYRLGAGDKLRITIFGHEDVSGEFVIDGSGNIAMPLLGQFQAGGLTVTELQTSLHDELNKNYIVDPRVSVEVQNYRPFFILGEVNSPGSYPYVAGITLLEAVAIGGGYTRRARTSSATVTRATTDGREKMTLPPEALVFPGDTINIERRLF